MRWNRPGPISGSSTTDTSMILPSAGAMTTPAGP